MYLESCILRLGRKVNLRLPSNLTSTCQAGNVSSNSLLGNQLKARVGLFDLCMQVQILQKSVDITRIGALRTCKSTYLMITAKKSAWSRWTQ